MSKFNRGRQAVKVNSPMGTEAVPSGRTYNRAVAFAKDDKTELFLMTIGSFFGEDKYYENKLVTEERFNDLVRKLSVEDFEWLTKLVGWARHEANMRTAPLVIALEAVHNRLSANLSGGNRQIILSSFGRDDEPQEAIAYWVANYGKNLPMPLKRAVADYLSHSASLYGYFKYGRSGNFKFKDLIRLTHPRPTDHTQNVAFRYILEKEDADIPETVVRRNRLLALPVADRKYVMAQELKDARFTWEQYAGWIQGEVNWNKMIPSMSYMALLRNLRNFEESGIRSEYVRDKLSNPRDVVWSKQFPFRFFSAYNELKGYFYTDALEQALDYSLKNIPELKGNTLILVDRSGSMFARVSERSKGTYYAVIAALFGTALAKKAEKADLIQFGTFSAKVPFDKATPTLKIVRDRFTEMGGTNIPDAIFANLRRDHDRLIIITDEQTSYHTRLPTDIPVYIWNLVGYRYGFNINQTNVHLFGGLSDNSFRLISLLEDLKDTKWPWETPLTDSLI